MKSINVLIFPGTNCELETQNMIERNGFNSEIIRWNEGSDKVFNSDGLVIPGGFSFEDRGRAGVIASKYSIMKTVKKMAIEGKPILGICNGAQILVESGLVPGFSDSQNLSLTDNIRNWKDKEYSGFYHDFVYIKSNGNGGIWNNFDGVINVPVANAEGRFFADKENIDLIHKYKQNAFLYCDKDGNVIDKFPINPNGSICNLAGVSNVHGNVLALMPHPERCINGDKIFNSLRKFYDKNNNTSIQEVNSSTSKKQSKNDDFSEIHIFLTITDNECLNIEKLTREEFGDSIKIKKSRVIKVDTLDLERIIKIIEENNFYNSGKEIVKIKIGNDFYNLNKEKIKEDSQKIYSFNKHQHSDDFIKKQGKCYFISEKLDKEKILQSGIFANLISCDLIID